MSGASSSSLSSSSFCFDFIYILCGLSLSTKVGCAEHPSVTANGDFFVLLPCGLRTRCAYRVIQQTGGCGWKERGEEEKTVS